MALSAVDSVDDAIDATKRFLLPFSWGTWLRLAFVLFFVGGGGGGLGNVQSFSNVGEEDVGGGTEIGDPGASPIDSGPEWLTLELILAAVAVVIAIALVLFVVGQVMQFVFVDALITEEIHVRRYFKRHFGNGLRLVLFRIVLTVVAFGVFALAAGAALLATVGAPDPTAIGAGLLLALPFLFLFVVVFGTINGFTNVFVVPIMIHENRGVFSAWGRLWGTIKREWKEFLAYLFFSVVLALGVGILATFAAIFAAILVGIPFGIVGFVIWTAASGTPMLVGLGIVGAVYALLLLVAVQMIQVPLQSFLRYYALLVLGDVDPELDPIGDIRADVRP